MKPKQAITIINVALRQMANSAFNVVLPFVVIHFSAKEIWGEFVSALLFILIATACSNFGSKEFLLREFSIQPGNIRRSFTENFFFRMPVLLLFLIVALCIFPLPNVIFIGLSIIGLYVSQSFEAVIVFEKKFRFSALVESLSGILFLGALLFFRNDITAVLILKLYACFQLLKAMVFGCFFFDLFEKAPTGFDLGFFKKGFPFFLLALMGFLASKSDVYLVDFFLSKRQLADYQILNSLSLFAMGTAAFFYTPFTKNIYRNKETVIHKLKNTLFVLGFVVTVAAVAVIYFVNGYYLKIAFPLYFYAIAFAYIFPCFIYGIEIVSLYRHHMEIKVVKYLFIGNMINIALSALFLNLGLDIIGALLGSAIAQLSILLVFVFRKKRAEPSGFQASG